MEKKTPEQALVHNFTSGNKNILSLPVIIIFLVVILLGIVAGYFLAGGNVFTTHVQSGANLSKSNIQVGQTYGSADLNSFKDNAEGTMQNGGIDGEGQFHLVRPGGDSQNVYLTSSNVDLSLFIGHKVKVWGQTQKAQHAGWLMDVGRVLVEQ